MKLKTTPLIPALHLLNVHAHDVRLGLVTDEHLSVERTEILFFRIVHRIAGGFREVVGKPENRVRSSFPEFFHRYLVQIPVVELRMIGEGRRVSVKFAFLHVKQRGRGNPVPLVVGDKQFVVRAHRDAGRRSQPECVGAHGPVRSNLHQTAPIVDDPGHDAAPDVALASVAQVQGDVEIAGAVSNRSKRKFMVISRKAPRVGDRSIHLRFPVLVRVNQFRQLRFLRDVCALTSVLEFNTQCVLHAVGKLLPVAVFIHPYFTVSGGDIERAIRCEFQSPHLQDDVIGNVDRLHGVTVRNGVRLRDGCRREKKEKQSE